MRDILLTILAAVAFIVLVIAIHFSWSLVLDRDEPAPAPAFTCAQTVSPDSAAILSADLWDRASRGERTRIFFECREGVTFIRLERVK